MHILPSTNPEDWGLNNVDELIHNVLALALSIAAIVAAIYIVIGAFQYFTAYGSEERATAGKTTLMWAIIGLVLIILARVVVGEIFRFVTPTLPGI